MLFFVLVEIFDGIIVGKFLASLCKSLLGDNPLGRLLKLIVPIGAGFGYSFWVHTVANSSSSEGSMVGFLALAFGPIAIVLILAIIGYMFNTENK